MHVYQVYSSRKGDIRTHQDQQEFINDQVFKKLFKQTVDWYIDYVTSFIDFKQHFNVQVYHIHIFKMLGISWSLGGYFEVFGHNFYSHKMQINY